MIKNNPCLEATLRVLLEAGHRPVVDRCGRHLKVRWTADGRDRFSKSPTRAPWSDATCT